MKYFFYLFIFCFFWGTPFSFSYPTYIRLGYHQCQACHFSSYGGGQLTEYGKTISAQDSLFTKEYNAKETPPLFSHSLQSRLMQLYKNKKNDFFPMQFDYLNRAQLNEKWSVDTVLGLDKKRSEEGFIIKNKKWYDYFVLRKFLLNYQLNEVLRFNLGRTMLPVGINIADHTAYIKSENRRFVTDYQTVFQVERALETKLFSGFIYAPSFEEKSSNQEYGSGGRFEWILGDRTLIGTSVFYGETEAIKRGGGNFFIRSAWSETMGVISEIAPTFRKLKKFNEQFFSQYAFYGAPFWNVTPYFQVSTVGEYYFRTPPFNSSAYRFGPSFTFKWVQYVTSILDYRYELRNKRPDHMVFLQLFLSI